MTVELAGLAMQANNDMTVQVESRKNQKLAFEDRLLELFEQADTSKDGRLTYDEFSSVFDDANVRAWCSSIDIEINEIHSLFNRLKELKPLLAEPRN